MAPIAGMVPGAADMLNGQLGDIDKLIMLSKLQNSTRPTCRSCWNAWRRPPSAASRTSARPIAVELPSADVCACGCTASNGTGLWRRLARHRRWRWRRPDASQTNDGSSRRHGLMRRHLSQSRSSMLKDSTLRQSIRQRQLTGRLTARQRQPGS